MSYFGSSNQPPNQQQQLIRPGSQLVFGQLQQQQQFSNQPPTSIMEPGFPSGAGDPLHHGHHGHLGNPMLLQQQQPTNYGNINVGFIADQLVSQASAALQNANLMGMQASMAPSGGSTFQAGLQQASGNTQSKQRVFTGTVTKTHDNFGFIDEEVFFQMSVVKGHVLPKAGDRVLVEADFNPNMPFKWNATRVQIVNIGTSSAPSSTSMSSKPLPTSGPNQQPGNYSQQGGVGIPPPPSITNPHYSSNPPPSRGANQMQSRPGGASATPSTLLQNPYHNNAVNVSQTSSYPSKLDQDLDLLNKKIRDRERDHYDSPSHHSRRSRSRSRDRRDREESRRSERRRSPVRRRSRSPPAYKAPEVSRRRERTRSRDRDESRRYQRERSKERDRRDSRSRAEHRQSPSLLSSSSTRSSRKRSRSRSADKKSEKRHRSSRSPSSKIGKSEKESEKQARHLVEVPRNNLTITDMSIIEIKRRYPDLRIPSDFFNVHSCWRKSDIKLTSLVLQDSATPLQIFRKHVDKVDIGKFVEKKDDKTGQIVRSVEEVGSSKAENPLGGSRSSLFTVKVVLVSVPTKSKLLEKCCGIKSDEKEDEQKNGDNGKSLALLHLTKILNIVLGVKGSGKNEPIVIGGKWDELLDGPNPHSNEQVLISTAIRSFKWFTGCDLSSCKNWYRFMEVYYKRENGLMETVVYFIPDLSTCNPTSEHWKAINTAYNWVFHGDEVKEEKKNDATGKDKKAGSSEVAKGNELKEPAIHVAAAVTASSNPVELENIAKSTVEQETETAKENGPAEFPTDDGGTEAELIGEAENSSKLDDKQDESLMDEKPNEAENEAKSNANPDDKPNIEEEPMDISEAAVAQEKSVTTPVDDESVNETANKNQQLLAEVKSMNVAKLKGELTKRGLSPKGLKTQLLKRLTDALEGQGQEVAPEQKEGPQDTIVTEASAPSVNQQSVDENCQTGESTVGHAEVKSEEGQENPEAEPSKPAGPMPDIMVPIMPGSIDSRAKRIWERRYQLPSKPHLLIYPTNTLQDFDCMQKSLSSAQEILLDVISAKGSSLTESTYETLFELQLFVKLFIEMIQYEFGFIIFKEIVKQNSKTSQSSQGKELEPPCEVRKEVKEKDGTKKVEEVVLVDEDTNEEQKVVNGGKSSIRAELLSLAFVFFDTNNGGSITENELQSLILSLGVGLSCSQIRKLLEPTVSSFASKSSISYKKWIELIGSKFTEGANGVDQELEEKLQSLIRGNNAHLPIFIYDSPTNDLTSEDVETEGMLCETEALGNDNEKLTSQLLKCKKNYLAQQRTSNVLENSLVQAKNEITELQKVNTQLSTDLTQTKDALTKLEAQDKTNQDDLDLFKRASERFCERISHLIEIQALSSNGTGSDIKEKGNGGGSDNVKREK